MTLYTAIILLADGQVISFAPSLQEKHGQRNENIIQRRWMWIWTLDKRKF